MNNRTVFILSIFIPSCFSCVCSAEEISYIDKGSTLAAQLHVKVTDEKNQILPSCITLTDTSGNSLWGLDEAGKPLAYEGQPRIWISGDTILRVTADTYRYIVSRPYSYRIASGTIVLSSGKKKSLSTKLEQIVNLPQFGWFGGDAHQHVVHGEKEFAVNLKTAIRIARAEGGDWSSFNSGWSSVPGENPSLDDLRKTARQSSTDQFSAFVGDEYPKDHLGHMAFLAGPIADWNEQIGKNEYSYADGAHEELAHFEILKQVFALGGISLYTHPVREYGGTPNSPANIARELPFDVLAAPDLVSTVDWMTDDPNDKDAMNLWAMYLNWGYKIGLCAFTDTCYDRRDARPFNRRTFVFLGAKYPTAENIIDAVKRGRTFGTTGPLMRVNINALPPGSVFPANYQPVTLSVDAFAPGMEFMRRDRQPVLDRIEIVRNGEIHETIPLKAQETATYRFSRELRDKENAWYIVKVFASGERQVAISSPFYFRKIYTHPDVLPLPKPVRSHVRGTVTDAETGKKISAKIELIAYAKDGGTLLETYPAHEGSYEIDYLPTLRMQARADGYKPQIKSIFFDTPELYRDLILPLRRAHQIDPTYYEKVKTVLRDVKMDFALQHE